MNPLIRVLNWEKEHQYRYFAFCPFGRYCVFRNGNGVWVYFGSTCISQTQNSTLKEGKLFAQLHFEEKLERCLLLNQRTLNKAKVYLWKKAL